MRVIRSQIGFTLVEMLVALAITSLVMTLLMGAMYYILQVRQKLSSEVFEGERLIRNQAWFRQLVHGIVPLHPKDPDAFVGDSKTFRAMIAPTLSANLEGAPELVQLRIESEGDRTSLVYLANGHSIAIETWPASASPYFEYMLRSGKTLDKWDPLAQTLEYIPRAIMLHFSKDGSDKHVLLARVDAEPWAERDAPQPFFMSGSGLGK